jgi:uncharacterized membrane protein
MAVSFDGSIASGGAPYGRRWTAALGIHEIPTRMTFACAADGLVVGGRDLLNDDLYYWSETGGYEYFDPPPNTQECAVRGISADGNIAVGRCQGGTGFRWTRGNPAALSFGFVLVPEAVSADGRTIVGGGNAPNRYHRWTARGFLSFGQEVGSAEAVSADGWRILGSNNGESYIWDPVTGVRDLRAYLVSLGLTDAGAWSSLRANRVSWNGTVLAGSGHNPQGQPQIWYARIPAFCYANCDGSTTAPAMNVADFTCFLRKFAQNDVYANCDNDASLNVADFTCFLEKFAAGCP